MFKDLLPALSTRRLMLLAAIHRRLFMWVRLVGITGSCGKTVTAALVSAVLCGGGSVKKRPMMGGHNFPRQGALAVLKTSMRSRYCVAELSGHEPGALSYVIRNLRPNIGIVTHIKSDHYTNFRNLKATASEKGRLIESLPRNGLAILNADDDHVWQMRNSTRARVVGCGASEHATLRLIKAHAAWPDRLTLQVECQGSTVSVQTRFLDESATFPVLAAMATGVLEGVSLSKIVTTIEAVDPLELRMAPHCTPGGVTMIADCWKSPLYSVASVLSFLLAAQANRKIIIIGSISDFPGSSSERYRQVARQSLDVADIVIFVGRWAANVSKLQSQYAPDRLVLFDTLAPCNEYLKANLRSGDLVLLKGSKRMDHFERIILDRTKPINCWRHQCRLKIHCGTCGFLYKPGRGAPKDVEPIAGEDVRKAGPA